MTGWQWALAAVLVVVASPIAILSCVFVWSFVRAVREIMR